MGKTRRQLVERNRGWMIDWLKEELDFLYAIADAADEYTDSPPDLKDQAEDKLLEALDAWQGSK